MKAENIRIGMTLVLKKERQEAYGKLTPYVYVDELRPHKTYKRTWVVSKPFGGQVEFYRTSDFSDVVK
jgi:hypothetical protein